MEELNQQTVKTSDKKESHIPVIDCPGKVQAGKTFQIKISLGNGTGHPDTEEHHIRRISLYYSDDDGKIVRQIAGIDFNTRNSSGDAPYSNYETLVSAQIAESGVLHAIAYCNVHGLAEAIKEITVI